MSQTHPFFRLCKMQVLHMYIVRDKIILLVPYFFTPSRDLEVKASDLLCKFYDFGYKR